MNCGWRQRVFRSCAAGVCGPLLWLLGCPKGPPVPGDGGSSCTAPFAPADGGIGCDPILPASNCDAGTMPVLGSVDCQPVGWVTCAAGFQPDPSGWGCVDVLPSAACTGATLEQLGSATCAPLGDCSAPFPPAAATYFVNAAYTSAQLDATHYQTLGAALAAAPAAGTVAIFDGTYVETLTLSRAVSLIGRCAANVTVKSPGGTAPGIAITGALSASVTGITVSGHLYGVEVLSGANLTLSECLLEANRRLGVLVYGPGSKLILNGSAIRDTVDDTNSNLGYGAQVQAGADLEATGSVFGHNQSIGIIAGVNQAKVTLTSSVVRDTQPDSSGQEGIGLDSGDTATISLVQSAVVNNRENAAGVTASGVLQLTDSIIRDTKPWANGEFGLGIGAELGASVQVTRSGIIANTSGGISLRDPGTNIALTDSLIRATQVSAGGVVAVEIGNGSSATLTRTAVVDNPEMGIYVSGGTLEVQSSFVRGTYATLRWADPRAIDVEGGSCAQVTGSSFLENQAAALLFNDPPAPGCEHHVVGSAVMRSLPTTQNPRGRGLSNQSSLVVVDSSAIVGCTEVALFAGAPDGGSTSVEVTRSVLRGTLSPYGHNLIARGGVAARLADCDVRDAQGIGLAFTGAGATVSGGYVVDNNIGVQIQGGSTLVEFATVPDTVTPGEVDVSDTTLFLGNQSKVGTGELPMPDPSGAYH